MPVTQSKALIKRFVTALSKGDVDAIAQLFPDDSHADVRSFHKMAHTALPDLKIKVEDTIAEKDKIVIRWTAQATHRGETDHPLLGKIRGTGKPITATGITILEIKDGKIIETWGETSELDALQQLGMLPKKPQ